MVFGLKGSVLFISLCVGLCGVADSKTSNIQEYVSLEKFIDHNKDTLNKKNYLKNSSFKSKNENWNHGKFYYFESNSGRKGSPSAVCDRKDAKSYSLSLQDVKLSPGGFYLISGWIKTENVQGKDSGASICLMYSRNGKYLKGIYPKGIKGTKDWTYISEKVFIPKNADKCTFSFYLRKGMSGKVWFDDMAITDLINVEFYIVHPASQAVFEDNPKITMRVNLSKKAKMLFRESDLRCIVQINRPGMKPQKRVFKVEKSTITADFGKLATAYYKLSYKLVDQKRKVILKNFTSGLKILPETSRQRNSICWIDAKGRAIKNNKPFMPIGLFLSNTPKKDLDLIAEKGFNCIMPYGTTCLSLDNSGRWDKKNENFKSIKGVLDYCVQKNLKVIFSLKDFYPWKKKQWSNVKGADKIVEKMVSKFNNHPAILSWYINDEETLDHLPELIARRNLVNRLDPYHPIWSVYCIFEDIPFSNRSYGILGIDPYPIKKINSDTMHEVTNAASIAYDTGMPLWVVPQIHDLSIYEAPKSPKRWKLYREPTEEELRSMCLQMAIYGAKGFMFWSYYNLYRPPFKTQKDFDKHWPEVCRVAKLLKELTPYIMSAKKARRVKIWTTKGEVFAKEFFDDASKKSRILITANGPGLSSAIITLAKGKKAKSRYGKTISLGNGKYKFTGNNICSDILYID